MTINELFENIYTNDNNSSPNAFIQIYEQNLTLIETQDISVSNEIYEIIMRLTADYAIKLKEKECYSKALPYLNKAIALFENYKEFDKGKMNDYEYYTQLRFSRGVSYYSLKKFTQAEIDFKWLSTNNPDNDIFKNWIFALRSRKYDLVIKILWYAIAASALFTAIIDKYSYRLIYLIILYFGVFSLIIAVIFETIKYLNKRKLNDSNN